MTNYGYINNSSPDALYSDVGSYSKATSTSDYSAAGAGTEMKVFSGNIRDWHNGADIGTGYEITSHEYSMLPGSGYVGI